LFKEKKGLDAIDKVLFCLPERERGVLASFFSGLVNRKKVTELRFRANAPASVTYEERNVSVFGGREIVLSEADMRSLFSRLCEESVHTYGSTMNEGYVTLSGGLRIGVCGKAVSDGTSVKNLREISSVAVRIPQAITGVSAEILPLIMKGQRIYSALFYALPGAGKTTLIRDIAAKLGAKRRVAVVDSRGEIYMREMFSRSLCDFLEGYPKGAGIEIATRTLSPEVIICDEIGDGEAEKILASQNTGVPLIATAHGGALCALMQRPGIKKLYEAGVFRYYIGVSRPCGASNYFFEVKDTAGVNI
jgi:stage III sporulation protein AA